MDSVLLRSEKLILDYDTERTGASLNRIEGCFARLNLCKNLQFQALYFECSQTIISVGLQLVMWSGSGWAAQ